MALAVVSLIGNISITQRLLILSKAADIPDAPHQSSIPSRPGGLFSPVQITPQCPHNSTKRRRVIDLTWVNVELPSLELRLNELWNVVDVFFISESTVSWKANPFKNQTLAPKPLSVTEHWEDFHRFHSKMVVNVIPPEISYNTKYDGSYAYEMAQRDEEWGALQRLLHPQEDDLLIFSDLDEIPRPDVIERLACAPSNKLPKMPVCLRTQDSFYYYNYKCHIRKEWTMRPKVSLYRSGKGGCMSKLVNASTHCSSCFGSVDLVRTKILSNADKMKDTPEQLSTASILDRVRNCKEVYLRHDQEKKMDLRDSVDYSKIPLIVAKHPDRWPYLLGKGPLYESDDLDGIGEGFMVQNHLMDDIPTEKLLANDTMDDTNTESRNEEVASLPLQTFMSKLKGIANATYNSINSPTNNMQTEETTSTTNKTWLAIASVCIDEGDTLSLNQVQTTRDYMPMTMQNHQAYANARGYDYHPMRHRFLELADKDVRWHKLLWVHQLLQNYSWVFFTDCDSLFLDFSIDVGRWAERNESSTTELVITGGQFWAMNSGQFLVRNRTWARSLLDDALKEPPNTHGNILAL